MATSANDLFRQAIEHLQAGRLDAERQLKALLRQQPDNVAALNILGGLFASMQRYSEAEPLLRSALTINSSSDATFYNYGIVLKGLGRPAEALQQFDKAVAINPAVAETWNNRGTVHNDLEHYEAAVADFDRALSLAPNNPTALCNKAKSLQALKQPAEALSAYDKALALAPNMIEAWIGRGHALAALARRVDAIAAFEQALALRPNLENLWLGKGELLRGLGRQEEAIQCYQQALALKPDLADAWLSQGNIFYELMRHEEALSCYERAALAQPENAETWLGRGNALTGLERHDEALAAHDKALALAPDLAGAWIGRGNALMGQRRYDEALRAHDKAIELNRGMPEAWVGRGNVLYRMIRIDDALAAYDRALALSRDMAAAWLGRGNVCYERRRYDECITAYDNALALDPGVAEGWRGRGNVLGELQRYGEAVAAYDKALALDPDLKDTAGLRLYRKMNLCDWSNFDVECAELISSIRNGRVVTSPFPLLSTPASSADQFQCAKLWMASEYPAATPLVDNRRRDHDRIRLAYLSADFRDHPVAQALAGMLERHDRSRFEIIGLSIGPGDDSSIRARIVRTFDQFHDLRLKSDFEAAKLIRGLEIDILVKVAPYTRHSRLGILAYRPAPIQVNGFSAWTSGADFVDYVLADPRALPLDEQPFFTERIAQVPDCYFPHDSTQQIANRTPSRTEAGLPQNAFVFCSFNRSYKLNPHIFDVWMRLLKRVDGAVLWLAQDNDQATSNLRQEAVKRDIDPSRLVFASRTASLEDHLARHRLADLFLDTLPYGAHTTAKDALWAGLPVLTCRGNTFAGRIAVSQLHALGLGELVATNFDEYEGAAIRLAQYPDQLNALRKKLAANRLDYPLFDTPRLCRNFEAAYIEMWECHSRGESPASFTVDPH